MEIIAKLFNIGGSQAVRIPKALQFQGVDRVRLCKDGDALILTPVRKDWLSFADEPEVDDDFMAERPALFDPNRVKF